MLKRWANLVMCMKTVAAKLWVGVVLVIGVVLSGCMEGFAGPMPREGEVAPEFVGIDAWVNSEPLSLQALRGKVVLVEFWTYSCVNCLRTLPHVNKWYDKYRDQDFVVVGVHTPEYEHEHGLASLESAVQRLGIDFPVAQDNSYATWRAYENRFWPAQYLIDKQGRIVRTHYGEGEYEETEEAIRKLVKG